MQSDLDQAFLDMIAPCGLDETLGIEYQFIGKEKVVATMAVTPKLHQPVGYLHGGASIVLAESVASVGGAANVFPNAMCFGMEINANHLRPVKDGILTAVGTPIHIGSKSQVWNVEISKDDGKLVCVSRCTLASVENKKD